MMPGDLLVAGAAAAGVGLVALRVLSPERSRLALRLLAATTALLGTALLLLTVAFLRDDFSVRAVHQFSSLDLPLHYKVAALYTSQEGSYLLWAFLTFLWALAFMKGRWQDPFARRLLPVVAVVGVALIAVTLRLSPFTPSGPEDLPATDGLSLNPLLRTPWVSIHPPAVFLAFSAMTILFAGALAHLASGEPGDRSWERATRGYARLSWLLLGFANALGAFWSYEVLGWGGFWAWDPVETSLLLPWLVLTAHLHAAARYRSRGEFPVAAPALGALAFVLVIYEALITRGGFVNSVHAFAASPSGPYLLAMMAGAGLATALFALRHRRRLNSATALPESEPFLKQNGTLLLAVVLGLLAATAIAGAFLTHPPLLQAATGLKVAYTREKYDLWLAPLLLGAALLMGYYSDRRRRLWLLAAFAGATLAASFWPGLTQMPHESAFYRSLAPHEAFLADRSKLALLPPALYLLPGAGSRLRALRWNRASAYRLSLGAIHAGLLLVATGYAVSSIAAFSTGEAVPLAAGGPADSVHGIRLVSVRGEATGAVISTEVVREFTFSEVGAGKAGVLVGSREPLPGPVVTVRGPMGMFPKSAGEPLTVMLAEEARLALGSPRFVQQALLSFDGSIAGAAEFEEDARWGSTTRPYIRRGLLSDTYVIFQGVLPDGTVALTVKEIPLASLVWAGVALMVAGGVGLLVVTRPRAQPLSRQNQV